MGVQTSWAFSKNKVSNVWHSATLETTNVAHMPRYKKAIIFFFLFALKNKNNDNIDERLNKILGIMRYRIASFRLNKAVSGIRNNRIDVNIPENKHEKRIEKLLAERGDVFVYQVEKENKSGHKIEGRFSSKVITITGKPLISNGSLQDLKIAELSDKSYLLIFILNPIAKHSFALFSEKLIGKDIALIVSGKWINISKIKEKFNSGQLAFPMNYPMEEAMSMLAVISLGPYPEAIELESVVRTEAPYIFGY